LQLGVDDQIRIERKLHRRATSKAVVGGSRTVDIAYETTVENHRPVTARISVHDHIPLSTDGDIKVRLREATPTPAEQTDLGELTWKLTLEPGKSAITRHRFPVEHPARVNVAGLCPARPRTAATNWRPLEGEDNDRCHRWHPDPASRTRAADPSDRLHRSDRH